MIQRFSFSTMFILLLSLGIFLTACQGSGIVAEIKEAPAATNEEAAGAPAAEEPANEVPAVDFSKKITITQPWNIVFVSGDQKYGEDLTTFDGYWDAAWQRLDQSAAELGVNVEQALIEVPCSQQDCIEAQIRIVAELLTQGQVQGIIIGAVDSNRLAPVIEKTIAAGIPVITMDTDVNSEARLAFVTMDNFLAGQVMGKWVVKQLGGQGNALILEGVSTQSNAIQRRDGFLAGLSTGDINVLDVEPANWNSDEAKVITEEWLKEYSDISAIVAANDRMALGAAEAVAEAGRDGIIITGFDALNEALEAIEAGKLAASIDQGPDVQAELALQLLLRHLETGEKFPDRIPLPEIPLISRENVADYLAAK